MEDCADVDAGGLTISSQEDADDLDVRAAYTDYHHQLFGFAVNGLGDRGAAEDCVQEVYLRAWRSRGRYRRSQGSPRTWLFAIARNVVIDTLRTRSRTPRPLPSEELGEEPAGAPSGAVDDRLVLWAALARLTPEHREVVAAVQLDGLSYGQLAERTGVGVATLRTRNFYALKALRALLQEEDDHGV